MAVPAVRVAGLRAAALAAPVAICSGARSLHVRPRRESWLPAAVSSSGKTSAAEWFAPKRSKAACRPRPWWPQHSEVPVAPAALRSVAEHDWASLDQEFPSLDEVLLQAESPQRTRLLDTYGVLHMWQQSPAQCRAGLFSCAYVVPGSIPFGPLVRGGSGNAYDRADLAHIIGKEAEAMVALLSSDALSWDSLAAFIITGVAPDFATLPCGEVRSLTRQDFAQAAMIVVADAAACSHENFASADEPFSPVGASKAAAKSFVGPKVRPAVELYWMSQLCEQLRWDFEVVPQIFDDCWRTIRRSSEMEARDAYWHAVEQQAHNGSFGHTDIKALEDCVAQNPFVAEPHVLLSQAFMQQNRLTDASRHALRALDLFHHWGTPWDKRASFGQWVAFTQVLVQQATVGRSGIDTAAAARVARAMPMPEHCGPAISTMFVEC